MKLSNKPRHYAPHKPRHGVPLVTNRDRSGHKSKGGMSKFGYFGDTFAEALMFLLGGSLMQKARKERHGGTTK